MMVKMTGRTAGVSHGVFRTAYCRVHLSLYRRTDASLKLPQVNDIWSFSFAYKSMLRVAGDCGRRVGDDVRDDGLRSARTREALLLRPRPLPVADAGVFGRLNVPVDAATADAKGGVIAETSEAASERSAMSSARGSGNVSV